MNTVLDFKQTQPVFAYFVCLFFFFLVIFLGMSIFCNIDILHFKINAFQKLEQMGKGRKLYRLPRGIVFTGICVVSLTSFLMIHIVPCLSSVWLLTSFLVASGSNILEACVLLLNIFFTKVLLNQISFHCRFSICIN